jgi:8-oxo-dGTP diphosphatase
MRHANAAKAFVRDQAGAVLLVQRRADDVHAAGAWDIPGGRLEPGEDPYGGCKRETREEIGIDVHVEHVLDVRHFTRDDGQAITMMIFQCRATSVDIRLSEEHTAYAWVAPDVAVERAPWLARALKNVTHEKVC